MEKKSNIPITIHLSVCYIIFILINYIVLYIAKDKISISLENNFVNLIVVIAIELMPFYIFNLIINKTLNPTQYLVWFWIQPILMYALSLILLFLWAIGANVEVIFVFGWLFSIFYFLFSFIMFVMLLYIINKSYKCIIRENVIGLDFLCFILISITIHFSLDRIINIFNIQNEVWLAILILIPWQFFTAFILDFIFIQKHKWFVQQTTQEVEN